MKKEEIEEMIESEISSVETGLTIDIEEIKKKVDTLDDSTSHELDRLFRIINDSISELEEKVMTHINNIYSDLDDAGV